MNITQIFDLAGSMMLYQDADTNVMVLKSFCKLKLENNFVYLYDYSTSNQTQVSGEPQVYQLDFNKITNPATPNANVLQFVINSYIQTGIPLTPVGYATSALQVQNISQFVSGNPQPSLFKDVADDGVFVNPATGRTYFKNLNLLDLITDNRLISITRPANVTAYTIGDAINDAVPFIMQFASLANNGVATLSDIVVVDSSNVAVKPIFNYFFFDSVPALQADNAPINIIDAVALPSFIGSVNGSTMNLVLSPAQSNSIQTLNITGGLPLLTTNGTGDIWVVIGLNNAYVPTSGEQFTFKFNFRTSK